MTTVEITPGKQDGFNIQKSINSINSINRLTKKMYMFLSVDSENAVGKIQYQFMIQTHSKLGIELKKSETKVTTGWLLLGALRKNPFHAFLLASGGCQLSLASLGYKHITPISASVLTWLCLSIG